MLSRQSTAALAGYAICGLLNPKIYASWCFGMVALAVNIAVWAFALHLLAGPPRRPFALGIPMNTRRYVSGIRAYLAFPLLGRIVSFCFCYGWQVAYMLQWLPTY